VSHPTFLLFISRGKNPPPPKNYFFYWPFSRAAPIVFSTPLCCPFFPGYQSLLFLISISVFTLFRSFFSGIFFFSPSRFFCPHSPFSRRKPWTPYVPIGWRIGQFVPFSLRFTYFAFPPPSQPPFFPFQSDLCTILPCCGLAPPNAVPFFGITPLNLFFSLPVRFYSLSPAHYLRIRKPATFFVVSLFAVPPLLFFFFFIQVLS